MAVKSTVSNWSNRPHGHCTQPQVIYHILQKMEYYDSVSLNIPITKLYKEYNSEFKVSYSAVCKWWLNYKLYGELQYETQAHLQKARKKHRRLSASAKITENELQQLKEIIDKNPSIYLG